jgi:site-specific DNA recombinase
LSFRQKRARIAPDRGSKPPIPKGKAMKAPRRQQSPRTIRCAIYARTAIDGGRATEFNSIRRQRKAIRAFIAKQESQGWFALPKIYEDVGQSAATMKRPALQELLADMSAGKVDCVVVHTFDRLTRSLSDRATLLAICDRYGVTLVTVSPPMADVFWEIGM